MRHYENSSTRGATRSPPRNDSRYDRPAAAAAAARSHHRDTSFSRPPDPYRKRGKGGPIGDIRFRSYQEEREWVEARRRKRQQRSSLFDKLPTEEQIALEELQKAALASHGPNPNVFLKPEDRVMGDSSSMHLPGLSLAASVLPQQTRHARRLYVGNLPDGLTDDKLHAFFRDCIVQAMKVDPLQEEEEEEEEANNNETPREDPILNIYMNDERHFAFVEFKSIDMTTACLQLNGINMDNLGPLIIKRPNDYNARIAPPVNVDFLKRFNVSRLGMVSSFVPDSPNKIYVSGLPFHLLDDQVKELLSAFGTLKAFHLVKADITSPVSLGYCFVEYVDESVRDIAIIGLNGMEIGGGGKTLTAKLASDRSDGEGADIGTAAMGGNVVNAVSSSIGSASVTTSATNSSGVSIPPPIMRYVDGMDVESLVDVAVGGSDKKIFASIPENPLDIANAALAAIYGPGGSSTSTFISKSTASTTTQTRILVLHNMVTDEDLSTEEDYHGLKEEVQEECQKYGTLISLKIPRPSDPYPPSARKKIYLEYDTVADAVSAEGELKGRKFGDSLVATSFFNESEYKADKLN